MVRARVQLKTDGPVTFTGRGMSMKRGESIITTDAADIAYFERNGSFTVSFLDGKPPPKSRPKSIKPPPPDVDDDDGKDDDADEGQAEGPAQANYTVGELNKLTKPSLMELAESEGVEFDSASTKAVIIDAILEADQDGED